MLELLRCKRDLDYYSLDLAKLPGYEMMPMPEKVAQQHPG